VESKVEITMKYLAERGPVGGAPFLRNAPLNVCNEVSNDL
jgi:hypothetical protein